MNLDRNRRSNDETRTYLLQCTEALVKLLCLQKHSSKVGPRISQLWIVLHRTMQSGRCKRPLLSVHRGYTQSEPFLGVR